jgi:hypothetical protein
MNPKEFIRELVGRGHRVITLPPNSAHPYLVVVMRAGKTNPHDPESRLAVHTEWGIRNLYPDRLPALLNALEVDKTEHELLRVFG